MRIIFNKRLREIRKYLKSHRLNCSDFIFDGDILRVTDNDKEQNNILNSLLKYDITKEQYKFMLEIYKNDRENYNKFLQIFISQGINISDDFIELYRENRQVATHLIQLQLQNKDKDYLDRQLYDLLGNELFLSNLDILAQISMDQIAPYIEKIKQNPSSLRCVNELVKSNSPYLEKLSSIIQKDNFGEIVSVINAIKSEPLINTILDNLDNQEIIEFSKVVIEKDGGKLYKHYRPIGDFSEGRFINEFLRYSVAPLSIELVEKLNFENLKVFARNARNNGSSTSWISDIALASTVGIQVNNIKNLRSIIEKAKNQGFPLSEEVKKVDEISQQFKEGMTNDETLKLMEYYLPDRSYRADYNKVLEWVKAFKSQELNEGLINPRNYVPYKMQQYSYVDENGYSNTCTIPIIKIDDPDFKMLIHTINIKTKDTSAHNYQLTEQLFNNPYIWQSVINGNPNISMSLAHQKIEAFGGGRLMLGFSSIESERLILTYSGDAATPIDKKKTEAIKESMNQDQDIMFENYEKLLNSRWYPSNKWDQYNEVLVERYLNNQSKNPDYIVMITGLDTSYPMETLYKWAAHFNIPIVEIDGLALKNKHNQKYQEILRVIEKSPILNKELIRALFVERHLIEKFSKKDEPFPTFYETFCAMLKNKNLNVLENAYVVKQVSDVFSSGGSQWHEPGYDMCTEAGKKAAMLRKQTIDLIVKQCVETMLKHSHAEIDILENGKKI